MKIVGNSHYQKSANGLLILNLLRRHPCSRVLIAHELGLQNSTVSYSVARLLENGTVREMETERQSKNDIPKVGRKPNLVELNADFGRVIGIEMMSGLFRVCICDILGMVKSKKEYIYSRKEVSFEAHVKESIQVSQALCGRNQTILGICIAVPGIVLEGNTCIEECWTHGLKNAEYKEFLDSFPFPVIFENDANCCAVKYLFNNDDPKDSFFYLLTRKHDSKKVPKDIPTIGIGLGLVVNGKLIRGSTSRSGEYRSSHLMGTETKGQIDFDEQALLHLEKDNDIQRALIKTIFSDLFCTVSILDPSMFYVGGFLTSLPYRTSVCEVLEHDLNDFWLKDGWEGEMVLVHDTHFDPSEGAADNVLDLLYKVPHVGRSEPDKGRWNSLLKGIV